MCSVLSWCVVSCAVPQVKPRPTYSYRDAMKTNPMLQQEKGKLMRRLVAAEVDSSSALPRPASAAGSASPAPYVTSSQAAATEPEDGLKLSYRIKLKRHRADDGFQVRGGTKLTPVLNRALVSGA